MTRPARGRPHSSAPHSKLENEAPRRTGPRVKIPEAPAPPISQTTSLPPAAPSVRKAKLSKPYASLTPQKPSARPATPSTPPTPSVHPAPNPAPLWEDSSSITSGTGVTKSGAASTRPNPKQCKKHGIQRNGKGECMMCKKEEQSSGGSWKIIVALVVLAVAGAGIAAVLT